jgi:hypothetical protein
MWGMPATRYHLIQPNTPPQLRGAVYSDREYRVGDFVRTSNRDGKVLSWKVAAIEESDDPTWTGTLAANMWTRANGRSYSPTSSSAPPPKSRSTDGAGSVNQAASPGGIREHSRNRVTSARKPADLVEQRSRLGLSYANARLEFPLLDGVWAVDYLVERVTERANFLVRKPNYDGLTIRLDQLHRRIMPCPRVSLANTDANESVAGDG